jgi:hypothetical protein
MQRLCRITVPDLLVKRDFTAARQRLLADFPGIQQVVATTAPGTLLVLYSGREDVDAWREVLESITTGQEKPAGRLIRRRGWSRRGDDFAA